MIEVTDSCVNAIFFDGRVFIPIVISQRNLRIHRSNPNFTFQKDVISCIIFTSMLARSGSIEYGAVAVPYSVSEHVHTHSLTITTLYPLAPPEGSSSTPKLSITLHTSFILRTSYFLLDTPIGLCYQTLWRKLRSLHSQELPRTILLSFVGVLQLRISYWNWSSIVSMGIMMIISNLWRLH